MQEATEQSRGRSPPEIQQIDSLFTLQESWNFQVFDLPATDISKRERKENAELPFLGIIGPEG